jgi:hypothetical protein
MASIARKVALFNKAYALAWPYIADMASSQAGSKAKKLHDLIKLQIQRGSDDPVLIAAEVVKQFENHRA